MFYWYSSLSHSWYVLTEFHVIVGYASSDNLIHDYPTAKFCPCVEKEAV